MAAMHVVVFHGLFMTTFQGQGNIMGSAQMPLFFVLSGYTLTVIYAQRPDMGIKEFFVLRAARLLPTYWLVSLATIPLIASGHKYMTWEELQKSFVWLLLPIHSWFNWYWSDILCGPSWTICTLFAFYLVFPPALKRLRGLSQTQLRNGIIFLSVLQAAIGLGCIHLSASVPAEFEKTKKLANSYWLSTGNPLSRWPVFFMGVLGGLYQLQGATESTSPKSWAWRSDLLHLALTLLMVGCFYFDHAEWSWLRYLLPMGTEDGVLKSPILHGNFHIQFICPPFQLAWILALTEDRGQSWTGRMFRAKWAQMLGSISMAIYLSHMPILKAAAWVQNGSIHYATEADVEERSQICDERKMVTYFTLIVACALVIPISYAIEQRFAEPVRRGLRTWLKREESTTQACRGAAVTSAVAFAMWWQLYLPECLV